MRQCNRCQYFTQDLDAEFCTTCGNSFRPAAMYAPSAPADKGISNTAKMVKNGCLSCCGIWLLIALVGFIANTVNPPVMSPEVQAMEDRAHAEAARQAEIQKDINQDVRAAQDRYLEAHRAADGQ